LRNGGDVHLGRRTICIFSRRRHRFGLTCFFIDCIIIAFDEILFGGNLARLQPACET
jgi:hypothetical protein